MLILDLYNIIFSYFLYFLYIIMYSLKIAGALKQMSVNEIRDVIFENYYKQVGVSKEDCYYSIKRLKKKELLLL